MKIILFGITNVGKTTIGKILSQKLNYKFDDLDDEIKRRYEKIDKFRAEYPYDWERHKKRGEILRDIINKYEDNVVIAVSPIFYVRFFNKILDDKNILAIELQDKPENILKRLVYADEDDKLYHIGIETEAEKKYYIKEIKKDITYYKRVYAKITNKFDIDGNDPLEATERLLIYIEELEKNKSRNEDVINGFRIFR